jgi:hypothetical protein
MHSVFEPSRSFIMRDLGGYPQGFIDSEGLSSNLAAEEKRPGCGTAGASILYFYCIWLGEILGHGRQGSENRDQ